MFESSLNILIGNAVALAACTVMMLVGFIHEKKRIIAAQCLQFTLMGISNIFLGATVGWIANIISIVRNALFIKVKPGKGLKIFFIAAQALFSLSAMTPNPISWLPLIAVGTLTWYIDCEDVIKFKWVIMITLALWTVYDLCHMNFISGWFDIFTVISTGYSIYKIKGRAKAVEA